MNDMEIALSSTQTLPAYKTLGKHRYRETSGLYYEDFEPGDVFEHRPGRTILDTDNTWMTLLTMNTQQLHFDAAYAATTEWKKTLVDSTLTLAMLTGMSVRTVSGKVVANLGWDKVKATGPLFAGDTLYAESTVLQKRLSAKRPTQGIVMVATRGLNQDGLVVMTFERTMLIYCRGHSPDEKRATDSRQSAILSPQESRMDMEAHPYENLENPATPLNAVYNDEVFPELRTSTRNACKQFGEEYLREISRAKRYPAEFIESITKAKWLSALIPKEYGGLGLGLAEASVILEEINRSGHNSGNCHAQMYNIGTLLRHGSDEQKSTICPRSRSATCGCSRWR